MAGKKIIELPSLGRGLISTDLLEVSTNGTGSYKITGQEIIDSSSTAWGDITGTLSNQTDLQNALNAKQDTLVSGTNIKTINGASILGSGNILTGTVTSVTATSPILSSGGNTPDISISQASSTTDGYLSSTDWNTFNNKQNAGNYITALNGEASASGPGLASVTLNNASVTGKVLTGVNITGGTIQATDTMLTAFGKLQNQINGLIGGSIYQGTWNASTNTPALASGVGTLGHYYIVNVAGTTNLDGISDWNIGDWAIFDGTAWQQVDNTDSVTSVNGQVGAVSLTTDNISEGTTNLYFTNGRARQSLSLTTTGDSGASTYDNTTGVLNVPNYTLSGIGGVPLSRMLTINGTAYDLSANRSWNVGTVTSVDMTVPTGLTITGAPITSSGTFALGLQSGYSIPTTANQSNWTTAYNDSIVSGTVSYGAGVTSIVLNQQDGGTISTGLIAGGATINDFVFFNGSNLGYAQLNATTPLSFDSSTKTFSISQATISTNGYLSSTDWNTFNNKQNAITLTTTGSSGAATLVGSTLNIPEYTLSGLGGVPTSRQLTINGTAYDLSADRSWSVGTVTSIATTGPITGGTITGSGTIGITQATTSTNGYLSSTDWNTFNSKQAALVSGTNIKTINFNSILGSGDIPLVATLSGTSPISASVGVNGNGSISISQATTSSDGYLSSTDWNTFNNKAAVNPTSGTIPINNSGSFADSKLSTWGANGNIRQVQNYAVDNTIGIFLDANGFGTVPGSKSGIEWGIFNLNSGSFGANTFLDCSIGLIPSQVGTFGSGIVIRTQASTQFTLSTFDTQVDMLRVKPFNVFNSQGGTAVLGGNSFAPSTAYFNVVGDLSYPPSYKSDYSCARFDGQMTAIVVPKVPASNQGMMTAENGMILYNTTTNKFQGYANGVWVDFH